MSEAENIEAIQRIYAAFGRGDVAYIVDQVAHDVHWHTYMDPIVPWAGDFSGVAKVPGFFKAIADAVDVTAFAPAEFVARGDTVVSTGEFGCKVRATGKSSHTKWIFVFKMRAGKVLSYEQFHDPAIATAFR